MRRGRSHATGREAVAFKPRRRVVGGDVTLVGPLGIVAAGGTPGVGVLTSFPGVYEIVLPCLLVLYAL